MTHIIALVSGVLFALGLALSGMTQPQKVQGFLDIFGNWDPSLAFVMGGAVITNVVLFRWVLRRPNPMVGDTFHVPTNKQIDGSLIVGNAIFGTGWALAGFCPGPALVSLGTFSGDVIIFVLAMLTGAFAHRIYKNI